MCQYPTHPPKHMGDQNITVMTKVTTKTYHGINKKRKDFGKEIADGMR